MMKKKLTRHMESLLERCPALTGIRQDMEDAYILMESMYVAQGKLLIAGNGGSAADAEHIVAELMKSFRQKRPVKQEMAGRLIALDGERGRWLAEHLECGLPAISLSSQTALMTAFGNDVDEKGIFAQQVYGYGKPGDVFLAISTSGNSENIINAAIIAKAMDMKVIALTGATGGVLAQMADIVVKVPEEETHLAQELHLPIYHTWCLMLEERFFGKG